MEQGHASLFCAQNDQFRERHKDGEECFMLSFLPLIVTREITHDIGIAQVLHCHAVQNSLFAHVKEGSSYGKGQEDFQSTQSKYI